MDDSKIDPVAQFEVDRLDPESQVTKINELNAFALDYPNHTFVSFLSSVKYENFSEMTPPQLNTLICSAKSPTELHRYENFSIESIPDQGNLSIGIYIKISHSHSELLNYISRNFASIYEDPDIGFLRKDEFKLLLKHKYISVQQEDQVIKAIILWEQLQATTRITQDEENIEDSPNPKITLGR